MTQSTGVQRQTLRYCLSQPQNTARVDGRITWARPGQSRTPGAELLRLKGEILLRSEPRTGPREAERCFLQAIEIAERQKGRSWELRATTSLARQWRDEGRLADARDRLQRVYSWFAEGGDTADLRAAKALLQTLERL